MGTRGCIARETGEGRFVGVYHHWDSYPMGLGKTLWDLYHGHFESNLTAMLRVLIDSHPAGWSTINGKDFRYPPGFTEFGNRLDPTSASANRPECYCHGDRSESEQVLTERNAQACGAEYAYVFREGEDKLVIMSSFTEDGEKMIGAFGMGDPNASWSRPVIIDLNGPEPDWELLDRHLNGQPQDTIRELELE